MWIHHSCGSLTKIQITAATTIQDRSAKRARVPAQRGTAS